MTGILFAFLDIVQVSFVRAVSAAQENTHFCMCLCVHTLYQLHTDRNVHWGVCMKLCLCVWLCVW